MRATVTNRRSEAPIIDWHYYWPEQSSTSEPHGLAGLAKLRSSSLTIVKLPPGRSQDF
jgi:hypothetical protein